MEQKKYPLFLELSKKKQFQINKPYTSQTQIYQVYSKQRLMKTTQQSGSFIQRQKPIFQGHILKFIHKGKSLKEKGIICFPQQTYGISQESPEEFKMRNTLVPKNGYLYRHQHKPQFKYYSQKRYFSIDGSIDPTLSQQINFLDSQNKVKFHRKKGRLSQFLDKNAWMNKTTKLMGFERDDRGRQFSNRERSLKIAQLKPKDKYTNPSALKPNTDAQYFRTLAIYTSQKMRIREKRNEVAQRYSRYIQSRQANSSSFRNESSIDRQNVQNRMLKTTRDWSPSKISKSNYNQSSKVMNTNRMLKFYNAKIDKRITQKEQQLENQHEKLQKWYRTTCSSKWVYNTKIQTDEDQTQF